MGVCFFRISNHAVLLGRSVALLEVGGKQCMEKDRTNLHHAPAKSWVKGHGRLWFMDELKLIIHPSQLLAGVWQKCVLTMYGWHKPDRFFYGYTRNY